MLEEGSPFILSPDGGFDVDVNRYLSRAVMLSRSINTRKAYADDLARFLTFLGLGRPGSREPIDWREATVEDRRRFNFWRNRSPEGPHVSARTWNREVTAVFQFYEWAVNEDLVTESPFETKKTWRSHRAGGGWVRVPTETRADDDASFATWLTASEYRQWRDIGIRGFTARGLPDTAFRGPQAGRNVAFVDLMVSSGMRLTEQAVLLKSDVPSRSGGNSHERLRLSARTTKGSKRRHVYVPHSVLGEIEAYCEFERAQVVEDAQMRGDYGSLEDWFLQSSPTVATVVGPSGEKRKLATLTARERMRVLVRTEAGLEPAALWLSERGLPLRPPSWQTIFRGANERNVKAGTGITCHPHALRHTYAMATLEKLQRGQNDVLADKSERQRMHYAQVFGDPINWLRLRLGHRSVTTTHLYLRLLGDLEMETRLRLLGDDQEWSLPVDDGNQITDHSMARTQL
ncbi:tyrosine-type recombinase/integrase [Frondihabitans australicus]|nr:site-specific integrase [Frondihabitans australicus]